MRYLYRAAAVGLVTGFAVLGGSGEAAAELIEPADAAEVVEELAEASAEQGICYGWYIEIDDDYETHLTLRDIGSNLGLGSDLGIDADPRRNPALCPKYVVFEASIHYTSASSEAEDSASFRVVSNLPGGPTGDDLEELGIREKDLVGQRDDDAAIRAILALPMLAAESGAAPYLTPEPNPSPIPAADHPTNPPGSDLWRQNGAALTLLGLGAVAALIWLIVALVKKPQEAAPTPPGKPARSAQSDGPSVIPPQPGGPSAGPGSSQPPPGPGLAQPSYKQES
ncbi:hypothetical protein C3Y87_20015 [Carbonactinospora thermoautotrophica]|uniref:hypothetical protein n=1 Tax=Carbonactinospora thermoautotrophica TaxID=1469144 RepID=UPI00226EA03A|nr:hypothetical protein [Carbonactinospora thermoautotrophica]MCX9193627.1 hypothetical protein [Carbonactinospora thermoautotrophica]